MHACAELVSHADYSGERLRKLGERDATGSELHLKNISLVIVHRKARCRNRKGEKSCPRCTAVVWESGSRRYGKGRTEVRDIAQKACGKWQC